jgi:fatty acid desaturase
MSINGFHNQLELMKIKSWNFFFRVILWFALMASGIHLWVVGGILCTIFGTVILGTAIAHGVELQHQCIHGNGFKNRSFNFIAGWILGAPMLVAFNSYKKQHLWHHRYLGTPMDKEFFQGSANSKLNTWPKIFAYIFQLNRLKVLTFRLPSHEDRSLVLIFLMGLTAAALMLHSASIIFGWLIALAFVAEPLHNFIELPEHYACDKSTRKVSLNSRTVLSNWFMTWLTNGNNFHVEHHSHPGVPMQNMRELHRMLKPSISNYHNGYCEFILALRENESGCERIV